MRMGVVIGEAVEEAPDLEDVIRRAQFAEEAGLHSAWMAQAFSWDAMGLLCVVGRETSRIELGTAVVPTYPRHPIVMAQQALTTQSASNGRFTLGIGLSHKPLMEDMYGLRFARHIDHMSDYLAVITPLLRGQSVAYRGDEYRVNIDLTIKESKPVPVVLAALGPRMLDLAGRASDGTLTWMTGPKTLGDHVVPRITKAAKEAGRASPRVIAGMPLVITEDANEALEVAKNAFVMMGALPSYKAMLEREGLNDPAEMAIVGTSVSVADRIKRLEDAGVTDLYAWVFTAKNNTVERTVEFLGSLS